MIIWSILDKRDADWLGLIPSFLSDEDPRPAAAQFNERYVWGGWQPFAGFALRKDVALGKDHGLKYPGDPVMWPVAQAQLRDEIICVYPHAWVAIFQADGSFEVCRMD
jgi:hypothetical protein